MIDYQLLADSVDYYAPRFRRIEAPWTVSEYVNNLTMPEGKQAYKLEHNKKCLVGSGEQSFLYLQIKGFLPPGKYQTITPCLRDEQFSIIHTKYFMKNELIVTDDVSEDQLQFVVNICHDFFVRVLGQKILQVKTEDGYDLMWNDIELGSYGIRDFQFIRYIYATGCAEPRTSYCKKLINGLSS
jgi:hypothetical protein